MDSIKFFSEKRLLSYTDEEEHKKNFLLIQKLAPKLGIIEIATRNIVASILVYTDDTFISKQTFGFWDKTINDAKIHNQILNLDKIILKRYSRFNKNDKLLNYQKVRIVYDLLVISRNRAFHFENLYKLNKSLTPRISTKVGKSLVGIDPDKLELFINDILDCFDNDLKSYI
ncbi:ATPase [Aliarcobacter butzleri]|uniref:ATPase n=1 Tax=Aliarcobacter butzleri TaxID=28197 RepID=UPI0002295C70|nr:ATPase [Aliarcobacter butzleri]MCG3688229.1 ATPase [Aliarcobacter butzleri]BAK70954.1 putative ATPase [Aliarcobacter butzleri ED-1]